jgi:hypothetical protein
MIYIYIYYFFLPFIYWWTFGLLPLFGYYDNAVQIHWCTNKDECYYENKPSNTHGEQIIHFSHWNTEKSGCSGTYLSSQHLQTEAGLQVWSHPGLFRETLSQKIIERIKISRRFSEFMEFYNPNSDFGAHQENVSWHVFRLGQWPVLGFSKHVLLILQNVPVSSSYSVRTPRCDLIAVLQDYGNQIPTVSFNFSPPFQFFL